MSNRKRRVQIAIPIAFPQKPQVRPPTQKPGMGLWQTVQIINIPVDK